MAQNSQYNAVMREYQELLVLKTGMRGRAHCPCVSADPVKATGTGNQRSGGGLRKAEPFRKSGKDKRDEGAAEEMRVPKKGARRKQRFPGYTRRCAIPVRTAKIQALGSRKAVPLLERARMRDSVRPVRH